jgi:hypothetical protein
MSKLVLTNLTLVFDVFTNTWWIPRVSTVRHEVIDTNLKLMYENVFIQ